MIEITSVGLLIHKKDSPKKGEANERKNLPYRI